MAPRPYAGTNQEHLDKILARGLDMSAGALSKLVGDEVCVSIHEFRLVPLNEIARTLGDPDHTVIGVSFRLTGQLEGRLLLLLERPGVLSLVDRLLKRPAGTTRTMDALERSAVEEVANILANAYLTEVGQEFGLAVLPSAPRFSELSLGDLLDSLVLEQSEIAVEDRFLLMKHTLVAPNLTLDGNLVLFLKRKA